MEVFVHEGQWDFSWDINKTGFMDRRQRKEETKPHLPFLSHLLQGKMVVSDAIMEILYNYLTASGSGLSPGSMTCGKRYPLICSFTEAFIYPQTCIKNLLQARHWARNSHDQRSYGPCVGRACCQSSGRGKGYRQGQLD